ncbi:MAG: hypothetical protein IJE92_03305 [Clostridia bacterium]|nr:hypothetical protein [Clostridia bacterium]
MPTALPKGEPIYRCGFPSKHKQYPMMSADSRVTPAPYNKMHRIAQGFAVKSQAELVSKTKTKRALQICKALC